MKLKVLDHSFSPAPIYMVFLNSEILFLTIKVRSVMINTFTFDSLLVELVILTDNCFAVCRLICLALGYLNSVLYVIAVPMYC